MFTGIIETFAEIINIKKENEKIVLTLSSPFTHEFKIDQSIAHNGICLTVESVSGNNYIVSAIPETIKKTTINSWKTGDIINIERSLRLSDRLDGHIVQGHVDTVATCSHISEIGGNYEFTFTIPSQFAGLIIEKGSISLNGISLTIYNVSTNSFTVGVIPYTYNNTNIRFLSAGAEVNIEFDILGKYILRNLQLKQ